MSLLKTPAELNSHILIKGLIYGQPGVGKTTLALSAPNPVLIDADKGMYRVEKRFQVPSLPLTEYSALLTLLNSDELNSFDTIIFDTLGKLVDRMGQHLTKVNPKNKQGDGSLSMKGWGALKLEFQKLLKKAEEKNKHLISVAHEREDKDGDTRIIRPDVSGSSGKDILKELDFMGYMEMRGNRRTISFTPCEKFYAKNSLRLESCLDIPDTDEGNDFIERVIINGTQKRLAEEQDMLEEYQTLLEAHQTAINNISSAEEANTFLQALKDFTPIWDSTRIAKKKLQEKTNALGLVYNKETGAFEAIEESKEDVSDHTLAA